MAGKAEGSSGYTQDDIIEALQSIERTSPMWGESAFDVYDRIKKAEGIIRSVSRADLNAAKEERVRREFNAAEAKKNNLANTPRSPLPRSIAEGLVPRDQVPPPVVTQDTQDTQDTPPVVTQDTQDTQDTPPVVTQDTQDTQDTPPVVTKPASDAKKTFVENSTKGVAGAKPGDWIKRVNGKEYQLNKGDIEWAKKQLGPQEEAKKQLGPQEEVKAAVEETPAVETPAVETPAVETPAVETPAVETPATDTPFTPTPYSHLYDEKPETMDVTKLSGLADGKSIAQGYWGREGEDVLQKDINDKGGKYIPPTDDASILIKNGRVYQYGTEITGDEGRALYDKYASNITGRPLYQGDYDRFGERLPEKPGDGGQAPRITLLPGDYVANGKAYRADGTEVPGKQGELIVKALGGKQQAPAADTPVTPVVTPFDYSTGGNPHARGKSIARGASDSDLFSILRNVPSGSGITRDTTDRARSKER